jgi:uncharacterized protein (DUF58 family)
MRGALVVAASLILLAGGCVNQQQVGPEPVKNFAEAKGLKVQVELPARNFQTGQTIPVTVRVSNTTGKPIEVTSPTGAPVLVRITRESLMHPEEIHVYPTSATTNILSYTIPAGEAWKKVLMVPVEPDWPVNEIIYLSAELNGYPAMAPSLAIMIKPAGK